MRQATFATLGNITIDDLVFADGTTMWRVPGGNSIYSALGMAVWGERPQVIAPVGPEYPSAALGGRIDLSGCRTIPHNMRNWGLYEEDGTRIFTFRSYVRDWREFSPTIADLRGGRCANVHVAPLPWQLQRDLIGALRENGTTLVSLDPDERNIHAIDRESLKDLLGRADLFMPSRQEAQAIFPGTAPLDALRCLRELAPDLPLIAVKCGAEGALVHFVPSRDYLRVPSAATDIVDQTGAGDAFCGGALVGFARTGDPVEAVLCGAVSASFAVAGLGVAGLLAASIEAAEERKARLGSRVQAHSF